MFFANQFEEELKITEEVKLQVMQLILRGRAEAGMDPLDI
jgi:hypothetical protein